MSDTNESNEREGAIPKVVLDLLKRDWPEPDISLFDATREKQGERVDKHTRYYTYGEETIPDGRTLVFTGEEVRRLKRAGLPALKDAILINRAGLMVNEHAQHALLDFLAVASAAWRKCEERLAELP